MNGQTITAFTTFESLLSTAISGLHESLQETHSFEAMYLDQFNAIREFQEKTKAFAQFLQDENEYHKKQYAEFKSKMNIQPTSHSLDNNNNNTPPVYAQDIDDIFEVNTGEMEEEEEEDIDVGLVSNNVSFIKGQKAAIKFIQYDAPKASYQSIEQHPHYHPLIHADINHNTQDIEGKHEQLQETAINGEAEDNQLQNYEIDIIKHQIVTFAHILNVLQQSSNNALFVKMYSYVGNVLLSLIKLNRDRNKTVIPTLSRDNNQNDKRCIKFDGMAVNLLNDNNTNGINDNINMEIIKIFIDVICDIIMKSDKYSIICNDLGELLKFDKFLTCNASSNSDQIIFQS